MFGWAFLALLVSSVVFVLFYGQRDERLVIVGLVFAGVLTGFINKRLSVPFDTFSPLMFANEAWLLLLVVIIAYRSKRFWPLAVASLELAAFLSLLAPLFGRNLVSYGMGVAQGIWAYLQLIILVLAVTRGRNRGKWTSSPSS
jgi:hypothetical protein